MEVFYKMKRTAKKLKTSGERYNTVDDKYEFTGYAADDIEPQLTALMIKHKIISTNKTNDVRQQ